MSNSEASSYVLEAHYYDGGLRHNHYPASLPRPEWVPNVERTGLRSEFKLPEKSAVVEFCRFGSAGENVDWIGVYYPSHDAEFGNRGNYAGLGIWLREQYVTQLRELLGFMQQIAEAIASGGLTTKISANIENLAAQFVSRSVTPALSDFTSDNAIRPAGQFAETSFELVGSGDGATTDNWSLVADRISFLQQIGGTETASRFLLLLAENAPVESVSKFSKLQNIPDLQAELLRNARSRLQKSIDSAKKLADEVVQLRSVNQKNIKNIEEYKENKISQDHQIHNLKLEIEEFNNGNIQFPIQIYEKIDKILFELDKQNSTLSRIENSSQNTIKMKTDYFPISQREYYGREKGNGNRARSNINANQISNDEDFSFVNKSVLMIGFVILLIVAVLALIIVWSLS